MGTNFYARIIPKEEDKQKLINVIAKDDYNNILKFANELYGNWDSQSGKGNVFHLGKRSSGWKFLWNPNVRFYSDGHFDENMKWIPKWKHEFTYPLTKQGITEFCLREDVIIFDEYNEILNNQKFLDMAFSWDGIDCKEYYTNPIYESGTPYYDDFRVVQKWTTLGYKPQYGEFYSDNLRFSTSQEFS